MPQHELLVELLQVERQIGALEEKRTRLLAQLERVDPPQPQAPPKPPLDLWEASTVSKQIVALLQGMAPKPLSAPEILEKIPSDNMHSVRAALQKLLKDKAIERVSHGHYRHAGRSLGI